MFIKLIQNWLLNKNMLVCLKRNKIKKLIKNGIR